MPALYFLMTGFTHYILEQVPTSSQIDGLTSVLCLKTAKVGHVAFLFPTVSASNSMPIRSVLREMSNKVVPESRGFDILNPLKSLERST